MTEAILQNNEILDLGENIIQYSLPKQENDDKFSMLMKNASSKVEKTQSDFIDRATKTNTSSINKYALENNNKNQTVNVKKDYSENSKVDKKNQTVKNENLSLNSNKKTGVQENNTTALKSQSGHSENQKVNSDSNLQNDFTKTPVGKTNNEANKVTKETTEEASKVNNDSLESSPVSLTTDDNNSIDIAISTKNEYPSEDVVEKTQQEVKAIAENILLTFDIQVNQNDDDSIDVNSIFDNISKDDTEGLNSLVKAVEEVSSQIDDMDLSQETKEKITLIFDKLKSEVQEVNDNFDFIKTIENAKKITENVLQKTNINTIDTELNNTDNLSQDDNSVKIISEIKDILEDVEKIVKNSGDTSKKEVVKKLENIVSKLEESSIKDDKTIDITDELSEKVKDVIKDLKKNNFENIEQKITDISKTVDSLKSEVKINEKKEVKINEKKEVKINEKKEVKIEKISNDEIEIKDDIVLKKDNVQKADELVNELKKFEKTDDYKKLSKEEKEEIKETIKKLEIISNKEIKKTDNKPAIQKSKDTTDKPAFIEEIKSDNSNKIEKNEQVSQNITEISPETKNDSRNNQFTKDYQKNDNSELKTDFKNKTDVKDNKIFKDNIKISNEAIKETLQETSEVTSKEITDSIADISEENQKIEPEKNVKLSANIVKEIKTDFLEDINYSNETSGALSVADEVMKMALSESNSALSRTSVGSVTYDSANSAITIKNIQNIVQQPIKDAPEVNILNQINDKLYQLKDSQKLTLVLRPDDLGRLSIELKTDKEGLCANIIAQNEHVRSYIEKNINNLRSQLSQAGVNVNTIQIKTAGDNNTSTYDGGSNREFQQEQQNQNQQNNQQKQQSKNKEENQFQNTQNYDLHFVKDFSSILNKTLSYMN